MLWHAGGTPQKSFSQYSHRTLWHGQLPVGHQQSYQPVPLACWLGLLQPNDQLLQQYLHHQLKRYPIKTGTRLRCPDRPGNHRYFGWVQSSLAFALQRVGLRLHRQQTADT